MAILFFMIIFLSTTQTTPAKLKHQNTVEDSYSPSPSPQPQPYPYMLESLYGFKPRKPTTSTIPAEPYDFVYGWTYGKVMLGVPLDTIGLTQAGNMDTLNLDFYVQSCPNVEQIVYSQVQSILATNEKAPAQLLRLFFHDCFIEGCDASVLLTDTTNQVERDAIPNQSLKGFEFIDRIKMEVEKECPGVVSCADILALAARESISQSGGPYYPLLTGRRDSRASFFGKALAEIPSPFASLNQTLRLFSLRGFTPREMVTLLGGHNIGHINCSLILRRIKANPPDPFLSLDFAAELQQQCQDPNNAVRSPESPDASSPTQSAFGHQYYDVVIRERGLLLSDMQLMTMEETADVVAEYASDVDGITFEREFIIAMGKLANLQPLTGSQGEIRNNCSVVN